ncbi:inorganic phosphate transporter [Shumkonia mesophila]|uniref:inorganic phosphate transporter n=1 Tax=Shumkonia mesophila TaxID=2838854 RepID=UPI00293490BA|nr:anion permease [Shumkonia mesophila]
MDVTVLLFLTSGLFLGWSLGANDAANIFGTAVGTGMVRFTQAAIVCSIFVILGAVISGAGAAQTLERLGEINALAGSFAAALAAAITVYWMTVAGLPVSTSQAIVGAIIGWNWFTESVTDAAALTKILSTWVLCPLLAGLVAALLFKLVAFVLGRVRLHLLRLDAYTRLALIVAGAFGAYSLGANNIANVMGVFVPVSPFTEFRVQDLFTVTSVEQLFLLGGIAIAVGVFTYSKRVMLTVGAELVPLSPVAAWVVVVAQSIVLFLFASEGLEHLLATSGLPTIPLVPVSSSQAVVGAVLGIGLLRGGRNIHWRVLGHIGIGWVATPIIAALICFVSLFFLQNVFNQKVHTETGYSLSRTVIDHLAAQGIATTPLDDVVGEEFASAVRLRDALRARRAFTEGEQAAVLETARVFRISFAPLRLTAFRANGLSDGQAAAVAALEGRSFRHKWQVAEALAGLSPEWRIVEETKVTKLDNKRIRQRLDLVYRSFHVE